MTKSGVEITFSADLTSAALISLPALVECGYTENNLSVILEKSDEDELQPKEAEMRHAYGSQAARRAKIAQARNNLLRSSLRARHNHVYWLDSDLLNFPVDSFRLLENSGFDVAVPLCANSDGHGVYDLNTWRETDESKRNIKIMDESGREDEPIFEGYGKQTFREGIGSIKDRAGDSRVEYGVEVDGVGGTMIYSAADVYRSGVEFATEVFEHCLETEGFAKIAKSKGWKVGALPNLVISHA
ncbi:hypothetical protein TrVE_jg3372 [Triparma verrucosa]|uniref:Uncharacterized protein n=1 Tax=Triparma verrucosa TaxID=1606542 RepID=A0A9W7FN40_9STRA|nr:hypothetical protein TrVE_jg3372 [Triparma verrucosa]